MCAQVFVWVCVYMNMHHRIIVCVCVFTFIRCVLYTSASELHHNTISTHTPLLGYPTIHLLDDS